MNILIIGTGDVGLELATMLSKEEHNVCVIDNDEQLIENAREKVDARFFLGSGTNANVLEKAGIEETDLFIAVSSVDEVNVMSCLLAKEYGVKRCVARVINNDYVLDGSKLNSLDLGIEKIVNPLQVVSEEVTELSNFGDISELAKFCENELLHLGYPIKGGSKNIGKKLKGMSTIDGEKKLVITSITRNDKTFIPSKNEAIQEGDMIYFFCLKKDLGAVRRRFHVAYHSTKNIFIIGGGRIGYEVAKRLEQTHNNVKVFDKDREICDKIAKELNVDVFCTLNTDVQTLEDEGIDSTDVAVTLMNDDYSNILTALLAKKLGAGKVISLVNSKRLRNLAYSLGVDSAISPRLATASAILKYLRRGNIVSVVEKLGAELLEVKITSHSPITMNVIKDLSRPEGVIFGAVKRDDEILLLSGNDRVKVGDILVVYSLSRSIPKLEELLQI